MSRPVVLVLGASGFIGSRAALALAASCRVHGTFRDNDGLALHGVELHQLDLLDDSAIRALLRGLRPEVVVHAAGTKDIAFCEEHPEDAWRVHTLAARSVAEECARLQARLVYLSTDCVFGGRRTCYTERDPVGPINAYGRAKLAAERAILATPVRAAILRTSLVLGWALPGQSSNTAHDVVAALTAGRTIRLPVSLFNTPLLVDHVATALREAALRPLAGLYHLAGPTRVSRHALGQATALAFDLDASLVEAVPGDLGLRPANACLDASRLKRVLGFAMPPLAEELSAMRSQPPVPPGIAVTVSDRAIRRLAPAWL